MHYFPELFQGFGEKGSIFKEIKGLDFYFAIFKDFQVFKHCYEP
jgi:hypothetical protein